VEGKKMSKSLGNYITVRELIDEGYDPASIRHQLISSQYRRELNFTRDGLDASRNAVQRLLDFEARLEATPVAEDAAPTALPTLAEKAQADFRTAMEDDFNSSDALAAVFVLVSGVNAALDGAGATRPEERDAVLAAMRDVDQVLGLLEVAHASRGVDDDTVAWVEERIEARAQARKDRDFAAADAIRDELAEKGIVLEDGGEGTRWKVV
jgi:cysteinyl-tRNA synthetase